MKVENCIDETPAEEIADSLRKKEVSQTMHGHCKLDISLSLYLTFI
jgi:hypothetical protein